jgi:hypothetical protein
MLEPVRVAEDHPPLQPVGIGAVRSKPAPGSVGMTACLLISVNAWAVNVLV